MNQFVEKSIESQTDNIPRCENCKAFTNPFFEFIPGRKTFKCNLCQFVQPTPKNYQDPYGDYSTTEIGNGSYEFYASSQYMARPPKEPSYFFLIDISPSSYEANVPFYAIAAIKESIRTSRFHGEKAVSIGIAFFDNQIHLTKLKLDNKLTLVTLNPSTENKFGVPSVR